MKETELLNIEISDAIAHLGHMDELIICFEKNAAVETMPHTNFKQRSRSAKAVLRTGDFTAYSNILLVSGAGPRWFVEKE